MITTEAARRRRNSGVSSSPSISGASTSGTVSPRGTRCRARRAWDGHRNREATKSRALRDRVIVGDGEQHDGEHERDRPALEPLAAPAEIDGLRDGLVGIHLRRLAVVATEIRSPLIDEEVRRQLGRLVDLDVRHTERERGQVVGHLALRPLVAGLRGLDGNKAGQRNRSAWVASSVGLVSPLLYCAKACCSSRNCVSTLALLCSWSTVSATA